MYTFAPDAASGAILAPDGKSLLYAVASRREAGIYRQLWTRQHNPTGCLDEKTRSRFRPNPPTPTPLSSYLLNSEPVKGFRNAVSIGLRR
jgi:hypothetical protein